MRLPSFRIRTLMIAVATVGLLIEGGTELHRLVRLRNEYSMAAASHAATSRFYALSAAEHLEYAASFDQSAKLHRSGQSELIKELESRKPLPLLPATQLRVNVAHWMEQAADSYRAHAAKLQEKAAFYKQLEQKYERATRRPWLLVPPDPPKPK